ncbi:MAG: pyrophosphokinae [Nocardioides sp.]|uniref:GTP pyrophosphokinase n=1 Tax=Nocardioides sp. TaxID=35761 RepID=UPI00261206B6|nr:(p)ppGpp synthetase [Nocardioides sp.]MCW2833391.1 pyrophosphokinae [Nocardioides sp.]
MPASFLLGAVVNPAFVAAGEDRRHRPGEPPGAKRGQTRQAVPVPSPDQPAQLPAPAPTSRPVREAVRAYAARQPGLVAPTERFVELITILLDDAGINYLSVTGRTKSVASFAAKAARVVDDELLYPDPLNQVTDQIGVRVITYVHSDVAAVAELLDDELTILDDRDMGQETASAGGFGYASRHLLVTPDPDDPHDGKDHQAPYDAVRGHRASVQVRTVLQHAWAEFEHDIRYKGTDPEEYVPDLDRRFTLAAGLLELADREFSTIRERLQAVGPVSPEDSDPSDPRISGQELAAFLAGQYADAGWSHTDHYGWIGGLLLELGITSLDELGGLLTSVDPDAIIRRMGYRYPAGAVRRLDDALLAIFGQQYVDLTGNSHRVAKLTARLETMHAADA